MSATRTPLPDGDDRRVAVSDFEQNLVVLAGAGTGKTSLLVERLLNAIGGGVAAIDELAAITFTERAAAELRQRVAEGLERLRALAEGEGAAGEDSAARRSFRHLVDERALPSGPIAIRALAALERLDRARVQTIHAFCAELLRSWPIEAGVDPDFVVDTGELALAASGEAWESWLTSELGASSPPAQLSLFPPRDAPAATDASRRAETWRSALGALPLVELRRVALGLAEFDVPESLLRPPHAPPTAAELFGARAAALAAAIESLLGRASGLGATTARTLERLAAAAAALDRRGLAGFRAEAAPWLAGRLDESRLAAGRGARGVDPAELDDLWSRGRALARAVLRVDENLPARTVELLAPFALAFREHLLRRGQIGFDALLVLARDLLRDHPSVRERLKRRFRLLLVDEFQDTDPLQYEIVLFLAERCASSARDPFSAELAPGRLFVVGDPKQSIYRFRGADYTAFRQAVERVLAEGGRELCLTASFRSTNALVEPINAMFEAATTTSWLPSDVQPTYAPIRAVRDADSLPAAGPCVEIWTVDAARASRAAARRRIEGEILAVEIDRLVREQGVRPSRVSILFRAFTDIPLYLRPLRERDLPFVVDGGKEFLKRPEVLQYLAALRTLAQPADPVALLAFLRSPAGGVADADLAAWAAAGHPWDWRTAPDEGGRIAERCARLRRIAETTRDLPPAAVVRRVVRDTDLRALAAAGFEGAQRVANLDKLADAAAELAADGSLSLEEIVEVMQEGRLARLEADSPLSDDAAEAVRITTIHKMKGLESDVVFLPDLCRIEPRGGPRRDDPPVVTVRLADGRAAAGVRLKAAGSTVDSPSRAWYELERRRHEEAEEVRVLYVALTRARERLVLLVAPGDRSGAGSRWLAALEAWGYRADGRDGETLAGGRVLHRRVPVPPQHRAPRTDEPQRESGASARYAEALERLREQAGAGTFRPVVEDPGSEEVALAKRWTEAGEGPGGGERARTQDAPAPRSLARAAGIVVHRLLEGWDGRSPSWLRREAAARIAPVAEDEGVLASALAAEVEAILDGFAGSPLVARFAAAERMAVELPLLLRDERGLCRGSVDLLYRDGDAWVVADYKTDAERDPDRLAARYGPQLRLYREAVRQALDLEEPPRVELWLLRCGERLVLDDHALRRPPSAAP